MADDLVCKRCGGGGWLETVKCPDCDGRGYADDLLVREWIDEGDGAIRVERGGWDVTVVEEHNALACYAKKLLGDYHKLAAELAAMTVERDSYKINSGMMSEWGVELAASEAARGKARDDLMAIIEAHLEIEEDLGKRLLDIADGLCRTKEEGWKEMSELDAEEIGATTWPEPWREIDHVRWSLLHAEAERDDALWEIGRVNREAHLTGGGNVITIEGLLLAVLQKIQDMCERALPGSKRIKEDE